MTELQRSTGAPMTGSRPRRARRDCPAEPSSPRPPPWPPLAATAARALAAGAAGGPAAAPRRTARRRRTASWTTASGPRARGLARRHRRRHRAPSPDRRPGLRIAAPAGPHRLHRPAHRQDRHLGVRDLDLARSTAPPSPPRRSSPPGTPTPRPGTWIQVELRGTYADGTQTPWYVMGRWTAGDDRRRHPAHLGRRPDRRQEHASGPTPSPSTTRRAGCALASYQLRLTLYRKPGATADAHGLAARRDGARTSPTASRSPPRSPALGRELTVPRYSQEIHAGQYPEYDNGGEAWCSPTSSQMIIEYWGRKPTAEDLAWVNPAYADPQVCHAARYTFDYQYDGCGNWPFNAAYAATYKDMQAVVTRLGSLTDAGDADRRGHPGHNVPVVPQGGTDGRGLRHGGPPDDRHRLHGGRRRDRQRPGVAEQRRRCAASTSGASSRTSGSARSATNADGQGRVAAREASATCTSRRS